MADTPKKITDEVLAAAVAEFRLPPKEAKKVMAEMTPEKLKPVMIEERQFGVSGEARDDFARLYDAEIRRLGFCPLKKIGASPKDTTRCRVPLLNFQHFLVHHQIHLMLMADSRVQRSTNADARELVYPTSEKTMRAALGPDERKRMLKDPALRARLMKRREALRE